MRSKVKFNPWFTRKGAARYAANKLGVFYWKWRSQRHNKKLGIYIDIHGWFVGDSPRDDRKARKMDVTWDGPYYRGHEDTRLPIIIFFEKLRKEKESKKEYFLYQHPRWWGP